MFSGAQWPSRQLHVQWIAMPLVTAASSVKFDAIGGSCVFTELDVARGSCILSRVRCRRWQLRVQGSSMSLKALASPAELDDARGSCMCSGVRGCSRQLVIHSRSLLPATCPFCCGRHCIAQRPHPPRLSSWPRGLPSLDVKARQAVHSDNVLVDCCFLAVEVAFPWSKLVLFESAEDLGEAHRGAPASA